MFRGVFSFLVLCFAGTVMADFGDGMALYKNKDFGAAFTEFKRLSELGDHDAQFNLGVMYYRGEGVEHDPITAYVWMFLANEGKGGEDVGNETIVQKIYSNFDAVQKSEADKKRAEFVAAYGEAALVAKLAPVLSDAAGDNEVRPTRAVTPLYPEKMKMRGKGGFVDLIYGVGKDGTTRDFSVLDATEKDFIESALNALRAYQFEPVIVNGRTTDSYGRTMRVLYKMHESPVDSRKVLHSISELRGKAQNGTPVDQFKYAYFLELVPSFTKIKVDRRDVNRWYYSSASAGNVKAQFSLGKNLLYGQACTADAVKSFYWLEKASSKGVSDAQYLLAVEMLGGARLARNDSGAIALLQKAADAKNSNAQLRLAWIYATHADKKVRNVALAKAYLDKVPEDVFDQRTFYEVRAAVAAELGNFADALRWQNEVRAYLEKYKLPVASADEKLAAYKTQRAWVE